MNIGRVALEGKHYESSSTLTLHREFTLLPNENRKEMRLNVEASWTEHTRSPTRLAPCILLTVTPVSGREGRVAPPAPDDDPGPPIPPTRSCRPPSPYHPESQTPCRAKASDIR